MHMGILSMNQKIDFLNEDERLNFINELENVFFSNTFLQLALVFLAECDQVKYNLCCNIIKRHINRQKEKTNEQ
jgi:hypothetical protein